MYYMKCYVQATMLKPNKRQEPSEVNGQNQSQVKPKPKAKSQKPWAISQVKPSEAKWSQVKPSAAKCSQVQPSAAKWSRAKPKPKAKSQKPKAKSQVGTQMGDSSSKMHAKHRF